MDRFDLIIAALAAVVLFLHGLEGFSREVRTLGRDRLSAALERLTRNRFSGFALGAVFTAIVQSSSAVTALAVALVGAGTISFANSLAVLIGANVGTTATAWLVGYKLTGIGPFFIVASVVLSLVPGPMRVAGKSVFYFGFIFFSLDLLNNGLKPISEDPAFVEYLARASAPLIGVLAGALLTALVQSSSVVTGLAIILVQQGSLDIETAVAIIVGANAGTTVTGLIASIPMSPDARRTALANLFINLFGVVAVFPFIPWLAAWVTAHSERPGLSVALAHLVFNLGLAAVTLPFVRHIAAWLKPRGAGRAGE